MDVIYISYYIVIINLFYTYFKYTIIYILEYTIFVAYTMIYIPMAKVKSLFEITGTLSGLNFYTRKGVAVVRTAGGGFNGKAIRTQPSMVRVRENGNEFKGCMQTVRFFKQGLNPFLNTFKDGTLHQRLVSLFTKIKDLDAGAIRGERSVHGGMQTAAGRELLETYLLTSGMRLDGLLHQRVEFDWTTGLSVPDFDGGLVSFPGGASHLTLRVGWLTFDFDSYAFSFGSSAVLAVSATDKGTLVIPTPILNQADGVQVGIVLARFVQEVNGVFYPLKKEQEVVLEVIYVG